MNLDVDMGDVAADLADRIRDLTIENVVLKKAVEKMADQIKDLQSSAARYEADQAHHAEWRTSS